MPGNAAGHDRPRKRTTPKRGGGYWPRSKAKGEPGAV